MRIQDLAGWFPCDVSWESSPPIVEWRELGTTPFAEPFFFQTVARMASSNLQRTPIDVLAELGDEAVEDRPTGFLFHMSRCGSTLATRLLSSSGRSLVLSEPDAINKILGAPATIPKPFRTRCLRGLVRALDQRRPRSQEHFFIKFTSWTVMESPFIREAFPEVPCCFLFRDPVEVMVSLIDDPPAWLMASLESERNRRASLGASKPTVEELCARMLAHFCRIALASPGDGMQFINYRSLPTAVWTTIADRFQVRFTPDEVGRMSELAKVNAKDIQGVRKFEGDSTVKQRKASEAIHQMAAKFVGDPFRELERRASGCDLGSTA